MLCLLSVWYVLRRSLIPGARGWQPADDGEINAEAAGGHTEGAEIIFLGQRSSPRGGQRLSSLIAMTSGEALRLEWGAGIAVLVPWTPKTDRIAGPQGGCNGGDKGNQGSRGFRGIGL